MGTIERVLTAKPPVVEELHIRRPGVYVSLVVNRRHRSARVVDFLAGNFVQKMQAINTVALKEGIVRVCTLVEREESLGWLKVGYAREGSIPAYYKRSDAYLMGHLVSLRPVLTDEGVPAAPVADVNRAEKMIAQAKKLVAEVTAPKGMRAEVLSEAVAAARYGAAKKRPAWLDDRFGRTGTRLHVTARPTRASAKGTEQLVSAELQETFGNAYVQCATWPSRMEDAPVLVSALNALSEELASRSIGCVFSASPAECAPVAAAMLAARYRKTGLLAKHLVVGDKRVDAILWTRRPDDDAS